MRDSTKQSDTRTETAKRPRGRPRAYEPEVALEQLTDAFWKAGYAGTSLDDISAATGMNRPSLRAAFGEKHTMYLKALAGYWEHQFEVMHEALAGDDPLEAALIRAYDAALSIYFSGGGRARGCFVVGTAVTEALEDPEIRASLAAGFRKLDACFAERLQTAQDRGELSKGADPEALALLASATLHTIAIRARAGASRNELKKFARKAAGVICA